MINPTDGAIKANKCKSFSVPARNIGNLDRGISSGECRLPERCSEMSLLASSSRLVNNVFPNSPSTPIVSQGANLPGYRLCVGGESVQGFSEYDILWTHPL